MKFLKTSDRFDNNKTNAPYTTDKSTPISTRNIYALFGDGGQDLFRHGLSELTPNNQSLTNPNDTEIGTSRLSQYDTNGNTANFPFDNSASAAKEDPVMFGFDIVIRTSESPLFSNELQDSVNGFFNSDVVDGNDEMLSRRNTWVEFKSQFFQFFRDTLENKPYVDSPNQDNPSNSRFYYYLKKVSGLESLVENNTSDSKKSFIDYGKDIIKLEFSEDVTLRVGRLAQLYKTLYWSRLNGKTMIPENLLRFDCDIIISEVRNFAKVKKALNSNSKNDLQILKDNINRYVYTLYECQLFFDKMPHPGEVDLGSVPIEYTGYGMGFNYKFSTLRLDIFDPLQEKYNVINNGTYNPYSITPFDKFLNVTSAITSSTQSSIGESSVNKEKQVEIEVIKYNDNNVATNKQNSETNGNISNDDLANQPDTTIKDMKSTGQDGDSINKMKSDLSDIETSQFKDSTSSSGGTIVSDKRWGRPSVLPGTHTAGESNVNKKKDISSKESDSLQSDIFGGNNALSKKNQLNKIIDDAKSGAPKDSWLNANSPGARFAKRIANAGVVALNQSIASRAGLLNKTLNNISGSVISNRIIPPTNIYETSFNGQLYLASKLVRDSLYKFAGESISDLFKKP